MSPACDPPGVDLPERIDLSTFLGLICHKVSDMYIRTSKIFTLAVYEGRDTEHAEGGEPEGEDDDLLDEHPLCQEAAQAWSSFRLLPVPRWLVINALDVQCWKCRRRLQLSCNDMSQDLRQFNLSQKLDFDRKDSDYL